MVEAREIRKQRCPAQVWAVSLVYAVCLAALTTVGCQSTNESRSKPGDPLVGEIPPPTTPSVGPTPPPQNRANMATPQTPQSTASKSNADIVANLAEPLDGSKRLVIAD